MTPMNAVFRNVWKVSSQFGEVTDLLTDTTGYPFIHMKESYDQQGNNTELTGTVTQVVDVWGLRTQRNDVDAIVVKLHNQFRQIRESFNYYTRLTNFKHEQIPDNSSGTSYVRYRIEADFFYTKKEAIK